MNLGCLHARRSLAIGNIRNGTLPKRCLPRWNLAGKPIIDASKLQNKFACFFGSSQVLGKVKCFRNCSFSSGAALYPMSDCAVRRSGKSTRVNCVVNIDESHILPGDEVKRVTAGSGVR